MIYKEGNLLDALSRTDAIAHGCNCRGVWGSGVAKQMKERFPDAFTGYKRWCDVALSPREIIGRVHRYEPETGIIFNMFTQEDYGRDSSQRYVSYDALDACFDWANEYCQKQDLTLNIPDLIGAGLGGGNRKVIESIIQAQEKYYGKEVVVWQYKA